MENNCYNFYVKITDLRMQEPPPLFLDFLPEYPPPPGGTSTASNAPSARAPDRR